MLLSILRPLHCHVKGKRRAEGIHEGYRGPLSRNKEPYTRVEGDRSIYQSYLRRSENNWSGYRLRREVKKLTEINQQLRAKNRMLVIRIEKLEQHQMASKLEMKSVIPRRVIFSKLSKLSTRSCRIPQCNLISISATVSLRQSQ